MPIIRALVRGESWLLADPRSAWLYATDFAPSQAAADVRAFLTSADRLALARALGTDPNRTPARDLERMIVEKLDRGSLRLLRQTRPTPNVDPGVRLDPPDVAVPRLRPDPDDFEETNKSLFITHCPATFDPRRESLPITYLLRELEGQAVELAIRSKAKPEPPVLRRPLTAAQTKDGSSKFEWDGVDDNTGKPVDRDLSPFVVELIHDPTYRDDTLTSLPPASLVHVVEMEDLVFATGRAILMPDGGVDETAEGQERITGLHAIAAALRHAAFHSDAKLCVFGHTDTVGDDVDNLTLSRDRAANVLHVLEGDADAWANQCDQHYEVADFQRVLRWIAYTKGWPTDPGVVDNEFGNATRTARTNFRDRMNAEYGTALEQGVEQSIDDWRAYFVLFEEELARIMSGTAEDLARIRSKLELTDPAALGCGEAFPAEAPGANNLESATNRRVDLVFFDPDEVPDLSAEPAGSTLYGTKDYIAKYLPIGKGGGTCPVILRRCQ